jgi:hypothetical protein
MRDVYRKNLQKPVLTDNEVDAMRQQVIRLAQTLCEHVWGKLLY